MIGWVLAGIYDHPEIRDDVAATWAQMLDHQLPQLLPFESFRDELPKFHALPP